MKTMLSITEAAAAREAEQLSILVGNYEFIGPLTDTKSVANKAGILVVLLMNANEYELNALYECGDLKVAAQAELENQAELGGRIAVAVHYVAELNLEQLKNLKDEIWSEFEDTRGNT